MVSATSGGWNRTPWFLVTAPERQVGLVERARLASRISTLVAGHRLTLVCAPAGYGKTVALAEWARTRAEPVAWLSLTHFDADEMTLLRGVVTAVQRMARTSADPHHGPLLRLSPDANDVAAGYSALAAALESVTSPVVLVLDDAHHAAAAIATGALGALLEHGPETLKFVLASRDPLAQHVARARLVGTAAVIDAAELGFTEDDVLAAAEGLGCQLAPAEAAMIRSATAGWPVAVRMALVDRVARDGAQPTALPPAASADDTVLDDYIATEILGRLPPDLAEFILCVTTTDRTSSQLAAALSGRADSAALLEECVRRGLFLDRLAGADGRLAYRWHAAFSARCRTLLGRIDPDRADRLSSLAARSIADEFPHVAVELAVRGQDPALAVDIVRGHWLELVIESNAAVLDALVASLPPPWANDPEMLLVRACCRDVLADRVGARRLHDRAAAAVDAPGGGVEASRLRLLRSLAALFLEDDEQLLRKACQTLDDLLRGAHDLPPRTYACALFLLGWTLLRLRHNPQRATELLICAVDECHAVGIESVRRRAAANVAFALAFAGRLRQARASFDAVDTDLDDAWIAYDGGIAMFTEGYIAYWQDDLEAAEEAMQRVAELRGGYAPLARVYLAFIAALSGDRSRRDVAATGLALVSDVGERGMPWPVYKGLAHAKLAEAEGDLARAAELARRIDGTSFVPVTTAMVAELFRRAGESDAARDLIASQRELPMPSYVRACMLVTTALILRGEGDEDGAHAALEESLDLAVPEGVARPFGDGTVDLRALLAEHARWGTKHEAFLAERLARADSDPEPARGYASLTRRERQILHYLRTAMTVADIAAALSVSVNTVRTHQRSIYRKLDVSKRREAIRIRA